MVVTRIENNISALNSNRNLTDTQNSLFKALERLSSGRSLNRASDGAALLSISNNLQAEITAFNQAIENASSGVNLANTAEGGLSSTSDNLLRLRELTVQAGNGALDSTALQAIQDEADQIVSEIDATGNNTQFADQHLLDGGTDGTRSFSFQIGSQANQQVDLEVDDFTASGLSLSGIDLTTSEGQENALGAIDQAISDVSSQRAELGAFSNRLEGTINSLGVASENLAAAESRIGDTDYAAELAQLTSDQLRTQAGLSALIQSRIAPQNVLALLS